jgi:hypothetical protein
MTTQKIRVIFDGPPSHESGRFVEVETLDGKSINLGKWINNGNGMWALEFEVVTDSTPMVKHLPDSLHEASRYAEYGYKSNPNTLEASALASAHALIAIAKLLNR